ncbi:flagellar basal body P-ring formation chaperone FlgA [Halomonas chromatireducens]|uniref:Flagella basal body P-ring formation protein FlgA n=1 Tax=Halomonas chromatireducens TaxID=507626 RepID=A0A0X8HE42_9GAMM|nr:flagellar basal body P-ring formation chaperone FlgA [Halomonas chromatireducens]AMD00941.1 Flagella basal body P-ring formation protein FlgA precursor [Halomonas chromatireducens]
MQRLPFKLLFTLWPILASLALLPGIAKADDDALLQAVHGFLYSEAQPLGEEIIIELRPPSARMPECVSPQPFLTREGELPLGRVSVGVRCGSDGRQVRYMQAEIGVLGEYPVLAATLNAGDTVRPEHLEQRQGNLAELPNNALLDAEQIIGQLATRTLRAGQPLQAHQFRSLPLVERNQRVVVEARGTGFRVSREGEALEPGGLGDRIRIRFDSREVVTGRVAGEGMVIVDF